MTPSEDSPIIVDSHDIVPFFFLFLLFTFKCCRLLTLGDRVTFYLFLFCFNLFFDPFNPRIIDRAAGVHEFQVHSCEKNGTLMVPKKENSVWKTIYSRLERCPQVEPTRLGIRTYLLKIFVLFRYTSFLISVAMAPSSKLLLSFPLPPLPSLCFRCEVPKLQGVTQ